jgi:hypothetical protein
VPKFLRRLDFVHREGYCRVTGGRHDTAGTLHRNDVQDLGGPVWALAERRHSVLFFSFVLVRAKFMAGRK